MHSIDSNWDHLAYRHSFYLARLFDARNTESLASGRLLGNIQSSPTMQENGNANLVHDSGAVMFPPKIALRIDRLPTRIRSRLDPSSSRVKGHIQPSKTRLLLSWLSEIFRGGYSIGPLAFLVSHFRMEHPLHLHCGRPHHRTVWQCSDVLARWFRPETYKRRKAYR